MAAWGYEFYFLVPEILSALEDKIRIPARPCNILYFYSFNLPYQMSDGRKAITRICFKVQLQVVINQYR